MMLTPMLSENHFVSLLELYGTKDGLTKEEWEGSYNQRRALLSSRFRKEVIAEATRLLPDASVQNITDSSRVRAANATVQAMASRKAFIVNAVLTNPDRRVYARVPLLARSDVAEALFSVELLDKSFVDNFVRDLNAAVDGLGLGSKAKATPTVLSEFDANLKTLNAFPDPPLPQYVPISAKPSSQHRGGGALAARTMLWLWCWLLNGTTGAKDTRKSVPPGVMLRYPTKQSDASNAPLGSIISAEAVHWTDSGATAAAALDALDFLERLFDHGDEWIRSASGTPLGAGPPGSGIVALARTTRDPRLRPNMQATPFGDWPWARVKREMAEALGEVTLVSGVSRAMGYAATRAGRNDFRDAGVLAEEIGIEKLNTVLIWQMAKPTYSGPRVVPAVVEGNVGNWRGFRNPQHEHRGAPAMVQRDERSFYVDFELAGAGEMLAAGARKGDAPKLIFMIGVGRLVAGEWSYASFIADTLTPAGEASVIARWIHHMSSSVPSQFPNPIVYIYGPERNLLRDAVARMPVDHQAVVAAARKMTMVNVQKVVQGGNVVVQGMLTRSLKSVTKALQMHGLVDGEDARSEEVGNGGDAMAMALTAADFAVERGSSMAEAPGMEAIRKYNEIDCRDIGRILVYLRENH